MSKNNSLSNLTKTILKNISGRSKDIVEKRFGLFSDKEYTLHSIGTTLKVTRERIRQIEKEALKTLKKAKTPKEFNQFISEVKKILKANGGFCEQDFLFTLLKKKYDEKNIDKLFIFLATLDDTIIQVEKNNSCKAYWAIDKQSVDLVENVLRNINSLLSKANTPLSLKQIVESLSDKKITNKMIESILLIDNKISKNPANEYGLVRWPTIQPYSARDKAYFLMKYYIKKPIHFQELSNLMKKHDFPKLVQSSYIIPKKRNVSLQTIHNELIKDHRFVLIGHGVYALQEWGYTKGVVKDVIIDILQASNKALTEHEITQAVCKQRLVKDNTIRLSLRDKNIFKKNPEGKYVVNKSETENSNISPKERKDNSNILNA